MKKRIALYFSLFIIFKNVIPLFEGTGRDVRKFLNDTDCSVLEGYAL